MQDGAQGFRIVDGVQLHLPGIRIQRVTDQAGQVLLKQLAAGRMVNMQRRLPMCLTPGQRLIQTIQE